VLAMPSERIVAASPAAGRLLSPSGESVIGHLFQSFASDRATPGPGRLAGCRVDGAETFRVLRRDQRPGVGIRMWVRHIQGHSTGRLVLVMMLPTPSDPMPVAAAPAPAVLGVAGPDLVIEGVGAAAGELFGLPVADIPGRRLVDFVAADDAAVCLAAWHEAADTATGVAVTVDFAPHTHAAPTADGTLSPYDLLIFPLEPTPMCTFMVMPSVAGRGQPRQVRRATELAPLLMQLARDAEHNHLAGSVFHDMSEIDLPGINQLTTREREVVSRLIDGDRVPAIAGDLHLSQSTIRNHLTAVFAKLEVESQQQLLDRFKAARTARL
jgi:DNA-binding CsgD family transcriptional regulator/PAS domain-containing protein